MQPEKISICLPAYNAGLYIESTIESIIRQSYKNWELIISDNASTDNTATIIANLKQTDSRIIYNRNPNNIGYVKNVLSAVKRANSDLIAIYHADDIYESTILEKEFRVLTENSEISGVFVKHREFYGTKERFRDFPVFDKLERTPLWDEERNLFVGGKEFFIPALLEFGNFFACPGFMTRKESFLNFGGFTDNYPSNEDLELWIKYLLHDAKLAIINEVLLYYRRTSSQGYSKWASYPNLNPMYRIFDELVLPVYRMTPQELLAYNRLKAEGYVRAAFNAYLASDNVKCREHIRSSRKLHSFSAFSKNGLLQRYPVCFFFIRRMIRQMLFLPRAA